MVDKQIIKEANNNFLSRMVSSKRLENFSAQDKEFLKELRSQTFFITNQQKEKLNLILGIHPNREYFKGINLEELNSWERNFVKSVMYQKSKPTKNQMVIIRGLIDNYKDR